MKTETEACCGGCGRALDAQSSDYLTRYAHDFRDGILGACCAGNGGEDDGWGDAQGPEEGDI